MRNLILTLRHLVQEAAVASSPRKRAGVIVSGVKSAMGVGVCSLYLADEEGALILVATDGLNPESVGEIRLEPGEGLVGLIASSQHPLNLESAGAHPKYRYFPETGEERFEAFLGAPVVHGGMLVGVLVVEQHARRKFSEEEESFLVTVAANLGALHPSDFALEDSLPAEAGAGRPARRLKGVRGAPGVGIGRLVFTSDGTDLMSVSDIEVRDPDAELDRFRRAVAATRDDLAAGRRKLAESLSSEVADVFEVYQMLLDSTEFSGAVEQRIIAGNSATGALRSVVSNYADQFEQIDDAYLRARGEDIRNLGKSVYAHLRQVSPAPVADDEQIVLAGALVGIADIAAHPPSRLAGIVSVEGSSLSHTAVLARALGLPAVMGVEHLGHFQEDETVIVDGYQGQVLLSPPQAVRDEFARLIDFEHSLLEELARLRDLPAVTPDGARVNLYVNTGLLADMTPGLTHGAEGIGLFRSETPFLVRESFPSEDEQLEVYRTVVQTYKGMPVYMRTLDIGSDKPLPYYPVKEENPALGWRGVRFMLDHSDLFITQLRAMLRASAGSDSLHLMLPMAGAVAEVETFLALLDSARAQLAEEGLTVPRPKAGIMAEVPSIIPLLPFLAGRIDFVSIGSNDLSQYILAVDRNNARVTDLFDHLHPAVLLAVQEIVRRCHDLRIPVGLCGEMAADPCAAVLLLGMGIKTLSLAATSIPKIKWLIRTVSQSAAREQLDLALRSPHPAAIRSQLRSFLIYHGLEKLLEPGSNR